MISNTKNFEDIMYKLLKEMTGTQDLEALFEVFGKRDTMEVLGHCVENDYLFGFKTDRVSTGDVVADRLDNICVTYKGLKFIEDFEGEVTSIIAKHASKDAKFAKILSIIALIISIIAAIGTCISPFIAHLLSISSAT